MAEYPVLDAPRGGPARSVTDLDVLAFRFARPSHQLVHGRPDDAFGRMQLDPALQGPADRPDMIVGEVKEGAARFNPPAGDPAVLEVALARFGCCPSEHAGDLVHRLLQDGRAIAPAGHAVRLVAFGAATETVDRRWTTVSMKHVVPFLEMYLREHWDVLRHAQIKDSTLGLLALLEKCRAEVPLPAREHR